MLGDLFRHLCSKEIFESDDSDVSEDPEQTQPNLETNPPDTERPLNEEREKAKPYFDFKALPKPLHDKPVSQVPQTRFENLKTLEG